MAVIDARELSEDALVSVLLGSDVPVVVRSWQDSSSFGHILDEHGDVPIDVILEGGRYRGESTTEEPMALADYAAALRNASLPDSAYVFTELGGVDRWFVRRPNATFAWQTFEIPRETLLAADALPNDWSEQLWQCAQRPGELVWVPDLQQHATLNHAAWTIGLTMVMDVVAPLSPLHEAVQAGDAAEPAATAKPWSSFSGAARR
ncbi:hypothetical protein Ctob_014833 [Chrysochromulina tobinii]|uniref:Uncharacterized protein n=1 Tax=Chrysochromulina tobinii TaxID=1460289 RepID=A0A0M0JUZ4_9EUKA|nr:hypothetical protein Ctob_014833 [Chrysochromulina tobinii]|eukprot:KOO30481.1 hypothetical protein Ctob_014833 [Chrysochromulina sp. CCMP291]